MTTSIIPSNFVRFDSEGLELVVDTNTGLVYASKRAAARMLEVDEKTIRNAADSYTVINAQIHTPGGLQGADLLSADVVFDLAFKYHPALAQKMGSAGANIYMLRLAGYKVAIAPKTALELAKEQVKLLEQIEIQAGQIRLLEDATVRQAEIIDELFEYSSIIRIAKYNRCSETNFKWHILKSTSIMLGVEIKSAPCPRFGTKNLYSHNAWRLAYPGLSLPETTTLTIQAA